MKKTKIMRVWTSAYWPFICGGDVHMPVSAKLEVTGPVALGRGLKGWLVKPPWVNAKSFVVEATTGGIVGDSLAKVRRDVATAKMSVIKQQLQDEKERSKKARPVTPETFWEGFRR